MLAGRKLLLADDSITIQKVVELTFADEGVSVISVGSGNEAIERLAEVAPDIVLADVCMPALNGYEVCEYIKQNVTLKHIPVMLLVGSFEPFDEAEARRVGADDILTKPFQSIRRLIDKVGELVTRKQDSDEVPTAELPQIEQEPVEPVKLSPAELELTTANTQPLPMADPAAAEQLEADLTHASADSSTARKEVTAESSWDKQEMESTNSNLQNEASMDPGDVLLDLGDLRPASRPSAEDFVLDIDLNDDSGRNKVTPVASGEAWSSTSVHAFVEPEVSAPGIVEWEVVGERRSEPPAMKEREWERPASESSSSSRLERVLDEPLESVRHEQAPTPSGRISVEQLSPEVIDAIARRAVEQLSEKVVREIAWEVVPQLAELLIKRRLEEKESQPK